MAKKTKQTKKTISKTASSPAIAKPKKTASPAVPAATRQAAAPAVKKKRIRGSFSMPAADYALIADLKARAKANGRPAKKNELLRAGLHVLASLPPAELKTRLTDLVEATSTASKKPAKK